MQENKSNIIVYNDGELELKVSVEQESVWLNRNQIAELFGRDVKTIGKHINNIFIEGELVRFSVVANFATTASDGKIYDVEYYNLDVIISVGYRVKSQKGVRFKNSHDKFLIIDKKDVYHIGASLKDLGKKCFAFSKFELGSFNILERLKQVSY